MLGLSMMELMIIAVIALIVIGPEKFPDFAKIVMRTVRDLRGYVDEVQRDLSKELKPVKKEMNTLSRYSAEDYIDALAKSDQKNGDSSETEGQKDASGTEEQPVPQAQPDDTADGPAGGATEEASREPAESTAESAPNKPRFYEPPENQD